jgi:hypothetical protein
MYACLCAAAQCYFESRMCKVILNKLCGELFFMKINLRFGMDLLWLGQRGPFSLEFMNVLVTRIYMNKTGKNYVLGTIHILRNHIFRIFGPPSPPT